MHFHLCSLWLLVREELGMPPSEDEFIATMSSLRGGKAGGNHGVLPEMLKCCGAHLLEHLVQLFHQVWRDVVSLKNGRMP